MFTHLFTKLITEAALVNILQDSLSVVHFYVNYSMCYSQLRQLSISNLQQL